ncbi:MAG: DNA repair protein RecO [Pirellulales bacterium]
MASEKATAIVLRVIDFSETSNVVALYTREFGKVSGLAKGGRRPKGPFDSALDLLCLCRIVFLRKSSGTLDLLTEARLERRFRVTRGRLENLYAAYYVAELLLELTDEYDANSELFDLADSTLVELMGETPVAATLLRYELTLLRLLGHLPSLRECVECGKKMEPVRGMHFGMLDGGVLCGACRGGRRHVVAISPAVVQAMETFAAAADNGWRQYDFSRVNRGELRGILNQYIAHLMGKKPRLASFLGFLTR